MLWMYAVCALSIFVCLPFFLYYKKALHMKLAAAFKSLGTLCAASLALTAALRLDPQYWICFVALFLHAIADWILEFNMYIGTGFFIAGHICYIGFFTRLCPVAGFHLIAALCLLGIMVFLLWRWRKPIGKTMLLIAVYGTILCLASACAIACFTLNTLQGQLIAIGGALFFISDVMILARLLFTAGRSVDWIIMITYYAAQLLFGLSCLL